MCNLYTGLFKESLIYFMYMSGLCACTHVCQKRASDFPNCESQCGHWEMNSAPLEEQPLLLTPEP